MPSLVHWTVVVRYLYSQLWASTATTLPWRSAKGVSSMTASCRRSALPITRASGSPDLTVELRREPVPDKQQRDADGRDTGAESAPLAAVADRLGVSRRETLAHQARREQRRQTGRE